MEEELGQLLAGTQSPATTTRTQAEEGLQQLYPNESFPLALISIASHHTVQTEIRQSALLNLKNYVLAGWSPSLDEFKGQILLGEEVKSRVRNALLELSTNDSAERKIQNAASFVVSKIANADYPDQWPSLLDTLLHIIPEASDTRLHGALKVLAELVQDGLDEAQFFRAAQNLVNVLYTVAANNSRKAFLRALAVSVFRECFNTLQVIIEDHKQDVKAFAEHSLSNWVPVFLEVLSTPLGAPPEGNQSETDGTLELFRGTVALKVQVARVLVTIRNVLPSVLSPQSPALFSAVWDELSRLQPTYQNTFIENNAESRLEDTDGLPYTLDFVILEDLDFVQSCVRAPPVRKELENQLQKSDGSLDVPRESWMTRLIELAINYAQITSEEEGMWEIDVNVFLAEETSVTANYTARIACGDLTIKMGEWLKDPVIEGLAEYTKSLFSGSQDWRRQEASLYILEQILNDWQDYDKRMSPQISQAFIELARFAQKHDNPLLRARGHVVAGTLLKSSGEVLQTAAGDMVTEDLQRILEDESEIVQVSCIRALQHYLQALPRQQTLPMQAAIIHALQQWAAGKEVNELTEGDDMLITLVETLRDAIMLDTRICIHGGGLNLLFNLVSQAADNFQVTHLVSETFEEICGSIAQLGSDAYVQLCERVIPSLTGALDVGSMTEQTELQTLSAELVSQLTAHAPSPLPPGFVHQLMPKLHRLILTATDDELLRNSTMAVKHILRHDPDQILNWHTPDPNRKSGLEILLLIIDRLLAPTIDDNSASEVGGLAAVLVEKAGSDKLGPFLMQLLRGVAIRIASAEKAHFVQSLIMVFARLSLDNARDVVDFLTQMKIGGGDALQVVMAKWLESAPSFAGYEEIRLNVLALAKLYSLQDERLARVLVKGDLVVPQSDTIMTRSRARKNPDQFTVVPVPLKIIKVLIDEFGQAGGEVPGVSKTLGAGLAEEGEEEISEDEEDGDWEDEPGSPLVAGLGMSKQEILDFANESPGRKRQTDDATQAFLESFFREQGHDLRFQELFAALTPAEQARLRTVG